MFFTLNKVLRMTMLSLITFSFAFSSLGCKSDQSAVSDNQSVVSTESNTSSKDKADEIVITMAINGNPDFDDVIDEFNSSDNGYRIRACSH